MNNNILLYFFIFTTSFFTLYAQDVIILREELSDKYFYLDESYIECTIYVKERINKRLFNDFIVNKYPGKKICIILHVNYSNPSIQKINEICEKEISLIESILIDLK